MTHNARQHGLYVFRNDLVAIVHERPCTRSIEHREPGAGREPVDEIGGLPRIPDERLHIVEQCGCGEYFPRSEEHTSELQSHSDLVCRLLLEKKNSVTSLYDADRVSRAERPL